METAVAMIIVLLVGLAAGAVLARLLAAGERRRLATELEAAKAIGDAAVRDRQLAETQLGESRVAAARAAASLGAAQEDATRSRTEMQAARDAVEVAQREKGAAEVALAEQKTRNEAEATAIADKLQLLAGARDSLKAEFEALSGKIFDDRSKLLTEKSVASLEQVLKPVKDKLAEFQGKVEGIELQRTKDVASLGSELKHLGEIGLGMSEKADRLTTALTTQSQVRGAWGEQVLSRVLEVAGLREGVDFVTQEVHKLADGSMPRPDVVVNLPHEHRIVVDSKLSLVAYVEYTSAPDDAARNAALKRHVAAVRQHVRELSDKRYTDLLGPAALDFVIAFVPIEQAYLAAVEADNDLYDEAWRRHVMFACPSTLLYALRMVSHLWTQEAQAKNIEDIVKRGAELYDKFVGFTEDLQAVGVALKKAEGAYDGALGKLSTGTGNLVRQVEMLRELGVKPKKRVAQTLLDASTTKPPRPTIAPES